MRYANRYLPGRRALAVAATGAMALSFVPGMASADVAEVCEGQTEDEFPDAEGFWENEINCIANYDIVTGYEDGEYKPDRTVTRGQMAVYMTNVYEVATGEQIEASQDYFTDDENSVFEEAINEAAEVEIVQGVGGDEFNPNGIVTRAEMAGFVANTIEAVTGEDLNGEDEDHFTDDEQSGFEARINALATNGVVNGVTAEQYNPAEDVERGPMAGFTLNALGYLEDIGEFAPTQPTTNQTFTVTGAEAATNEVSTTASAGLTSNVWFVVGWVGAQKPWVSR